MNVAESTMMIELRAIHDRAADVGHTTLSNSSLVPPEKLAALNPDLLLLYF